MNGKFWTDAEKEIIRKEFPNRYTQDVCDMINRSYTGVANQAYKMGVYKSAEFKAKELQLQGDRLRVIGVKARFKKGTIPPNKGQKMSAELYAKCSGTMFKKGITPLNAKFDGYERIDKDGYAMIRISKGKFELKHRVLWEQQKGKIPKGMIITFKDGDKLNFNINNLQLLTKSENMNRNTIHRYPAEIKSTIRLITKLKKTTNEKQNR